MNVEIVKATHGQLEAIVELWIELMKYHQEIDPRYFENVLAHTDEYRNDVKAAIDDPGQLVCVALVDGQVKGFVTATATFSGARYLEPSAACQLGNIAVCADYRRSGIGHQLIQAVKNWSHENGLDRVELHVISANTPGRTFFQKAGFMDLFNLLSLKV